MIRVGRFAPAALIAAGACFATKGDIRMLEDEVRSMQATTIMNDAARRAQMDSASTATRRNIAELQQNLLRTSDSLRALSQRLGVFQATTQSNFDEAAREIIQMQAQLGQSVKNMQDVRQAFEERRDQMAAPAPDSTSKAGMPSPLVMYNDSRSQLQSGACAVARSGFQQLLAAYPNFEDAADAELYIGDSYKCDGNQAAADSVYKAIVAKYPKSPTAATALYRRGEALWKANKKNEARPILQSVIKNYPRSDAAVLAAGLLKSAP